MLEIVITILFTVALQITVEKGEKISEWYITLLCSLLPKLKRERHLSEWLEVVESNYIGKGLSAIGFSLSLTIGISKLLRQYSNINLIQYIVLRRIGKHTGSSVVNKLYYNILTIRSDENQEEKFYSRVRLLFVRFILLIRDTIESNILRKSLWLLGIKDTKPLNIQEVMNDGFENGFFNGPRGLRKTSVEEREKAIEFLCANLK